MPPRPKPPHKRAPHFLAEWREYREKTQSQVAEYLGVEQPTVSRLEAGKSPYDQDVLERLALFYQCDPSELITVDPATDYSVDALVRTLGAMQRAQAKAMIKGLIDTIKKQSGA